MMVHTVFDGFFSYINVENYVYLYFYEIMCYRPLKQIYCSLVFNITLNQFRIEKRTQRYHPLLSLTFSGLDSDRKIEKHRSSFYAKHAAWRIRVSFRQYYIFQNKSQEQLST